MHQIMMTLTALAVATWPRAAAHPLIASVPDVSPSRKSRATNATVNHLASPPSWNTCRIIIFIGENPHASKKSLARALNAQ
jgi:hypothetical protein